MAATMFKSYLSCRSFSVFLRSPVVCAKKKIEATQISKRSIEEPKRPSRPFFLFQLEKNSHFKKHNPELSGSERTEKVKKMWKELPETEREKYFSLYKTLYGKYLDDMYQHYKELKKLPNDVAVSTPVKKSLLKLWKAKLGRPTRPPHALLRFSMDHAQKLGKPFTVPQSITEGKAKWDQLPESEKEKYIEQAKAEQLKYDYDLHQWEKKMVEDGHDLLIRVKSLKLTKNLTAIDP